MDVKNIRDRFMELMTYQDPPQSMTPRELALVTAVTDEFNAAISQLQPKPEPGYRFTTEREDGC